MKISPFLGLLTLASLAACNHAPVESTAQAKSEAAIAKPSSDGKIVINQVSASGVGAEIGTVSAKDSPNGLVLKIKLKGLTPGVHGFHVHENPSCDPKDQKAAMAAGGHFDPQKTGKHEGPMGEGHKGDLMPLIADEKGDVNADMTLPRLTLADIQGRALMIHAGGDNFSDQPEPLGGGGARLACGVVK